MPAFDTSGLEKQAFSLASSIPTGSNTIGAVTQSGTWNIGTLTSITNAVTIQDGGNTITVDNGGTFAVQAAQSGTWNINNISGTVSLPTGAATAAKQPALGTAGTASADVITVQGIASMTPLLVNGSGVTQPISAASLPLPTGAATAANQSTIIGHVDGIEGLLTTIDADTSALAGAVSGTEMQVDVVAALPSGDNSIGRVKLTDGTDVADILDLTNSNPLTVAIVDGSGTQITSFGGGTQYTEGDTDASITGTAMLWEDTSDTLRPVSSAKPLPVNVVAGSSSGTEYTEDDAAAANPAGPMNMAVRADSLAAVTTTDGDNIALRATNKGELYVKQTDAVPVTDNGGSLTVDGTIAATQSGSWTLAANSGVDIGDVTINNGSGASAVNIQDGGNSITVDNGGTFATQDSQSITDNAAFTDGTSKVFVNGYIFDEVAGTALTENDAAAARIDSKRSQVAVIEDATTRGQRLAVSAAGAASANTAQIAGTTTATGNGTASAGCQRVTIASDNTAFTVNAAQATASSLNAQVVGNVAHDAADSGNPVKVGGVARTANPTAVAGGDRAAMFMDDVGRQVVVMNQCRDLVGVQQTTITSSTTETTIVTAGGAGVFRDITNLTITNSSSTALIVTLKDATAGTTRGIYALAANGGIVIPFPTPLAQASANNNWTLTCGSSVASIYVVATFVSNV